MGEAYIYVGHAYGQFENDKGEKQPYANMYVISPVSDYVSDDYQAFGYKAEKLKCVSPEVWNGLTPGEKVQLFFDAKKRVSLVTSVGSGIELEL